MTLNNDHYAYTDGFDPPREARVLNMTDDEYQEYYEKQVKSARGS